MTGLRVTAVERISLRVPFREGPRPWLEVDVPEVKYIDIVRVHTNSPSIIGYGEALPRYSQVGAATAAEQRIIGRSPAEMALDDRIGRGLQMALLDALGQHLEVPVWRLLRPEQVREACLLSWWSSQLTPMSAFTDETRTAVTEGYLAHKIKARPWANIVDAVTAIDEAAPTDYVVDIDWNGMLQTPGEAATALRRLDGIDRIGVHESPLARHDADGTALLRRQVARPLAEHFTDTHYRRHLRADAVDGFVLFQGGASRLLRDGDIAYAFDKAAWLQVLGAGLTTAFLLHLGAVAPAARWPTVSFLNVYADDLLVDPLHLVGGHADVPTAPGLGVRLDEDALERCRIDPAAPDEQPRRLLVVTTAGGRHRCFVDREQLRADALDRGWAPVVPDEARLDIVVDDGSADFDAEYRHAAGVG